MIPLAVYSLDYPPSPLVLIDFRDEWKPKTWEVLGRAADYTAAGILGWTGFGNLGYLAGKTSWNFFRHRHGANVDRTTRVSAYAELSHSLLLDDTLDPKLRDVLEKRLDHLSLNPFERRESQELEIAKRQYAALLVYARDPHGLPAELARARGREAVPLSHPAGERTLLTTATIASFGIYRHREPPTPEVLASIERHRRLEADTDYMRMVLSSTPRVEVAWNSQEVQRHLDDIAALKPTGRELDRGLAELIGQVFQQTSDPATRRRCLSCLAAMNSDGSRRELKRVSDDAFVPAEMRKLSDAYLANAGTPSDSASSEAVGIGSSMTQ